MMSSLKTKFNEMNNAFQSFVTEMKNQGKWDDVTVVVSSDFGRYDFTIFEYTPPRARLELVGIPVYDFIILLLIPLFLS